MRLHWVVICSVYFCCTLGKLPEVIDSDGYDITYYVALGVNREATVQQIKAAYRQLSLKYHPDKNQDADAEGKFEGIGVAYQTLADKENRRLYDIIGVGYHAHVSRQKQKQEKQRHAASLFYKGCFENRGKDRLLGGHLGCMPVESCATSAENAGIEHFGLAFPQNCHAGQAECWLIEACCAALPAAPHPECEVRGLYQGRRLGGSDRLAVYSIHDASAKKTEFEEEEQQVLEEEKEAARKAKREAEMARVERKKLYEDEKRGKETPWLLSAEVVGAEQALEALKAARREANIKVEFELSAKLTKDISAAERELKKVTKKARKAYKKTARGEL